jgi:hypothetical protein
MEQKLEYSWVVTQMLRVCKQIVEMASSNMDLPIAATPTGKRRELITEATIYMHKARQLLREAIEAE